MTRTESTIRNFKVAIIGQFFCVLVSFASRYIFLRFLNEEYLGLNGLFTNILSIFSLVELGVGPAINFSLYKPLAMHDTEQIKSLMRIYKKAYILIGSVIAVLGLLFTPFYPSMLDRVPDVPNLTVIYWLFIANTSISYFFSYKRSLIICDEKRYIATIYRYTFYFILNVVQIIILILTGNYILYLILQVICTFSENVGISIKADKMYPFLRDRNVKPVKKELITDIKNNVGAMVFHKIGGMVVMSTDNLILSKFVGLTAVGLYSNYYLITDALNKIISQVFVATTASVGNLNVSTTNEDRKRLKTAFDNLFFINFWIYGFCSCCLWVLFNPFISLWLGERLTFDRFTVLIIVINFYLTGMRKTALTFREATGAFYYDRYKPLVESCINIIASIFFVRKMGTAGVFLGTIISTLSTCTWVEPYVLYKHVFLEKCTGFLCLFFSYTLISVVACCATTLVAGWISVPNPYVNFIIRIIACIIIPNGIFLICFHKTTNFKFVLRIGKQITQKLHL